MLRLAILGSTRGTSMLPIITAIEQKQLNAEIAIVISNKKDALILQRAAQHHLEYAYLDSTTPGYNEKLSELIMQHQVNIIVLIGYMKILPKEFVNTWRNRIINVHPSLLPAFSGKMNNDVHGAVLQSGEKETGCTVHYVTEDVDAGPVLIQKKCPVLSSDTVDSLKERVQQLEGKALLEAIQLYESQYEH